jgi:hypothetical protein
LESIADTIADYREGEIEKPTPDHIDRWVTQFDEKVQIPLLRELNHVLQKTYFSRTTVSSFFGNQIALEQLAGVDPCKYWGKAHFLDIQQNGHSQKEILQLFGEALRAKYGLDITKCGGDGGDYIYLDDVLFTGNRIGSDLSSWILNTAPSKGNVHVVVIVAHRLGEWQCEERLKKAAISSGKDLKFTFWAALRIENRKKYRAQSEVLWPAFIPDDERLKAYMAEETDYPFEPRVPGGELENKIFSSEEGRQLLERELLLAGVKIRSFSKNPSKILRPLGYSNFGLGFGSMIVTYRNCPNNVPLALWWGEPTAEKSHPLSKWYPLFPRKTYSQVVSAFSAQDLYSQEVDFDFPF